MNRGDVVEVDWQYSDMSGGKVRPAVVVQADFLNGLIDDTILVQITSKKAWPPRHGGSAGPGRRDGLRAQHGLRGVLHQCQDV